MDVPWTMEARIVSWFASPCTWTCTSNWWRKPITMIMMMMMMMMMMIMMIIKMIMFIIILILFSSSPSPLVPEGFSAKARRLRGFRTLQWRTAGFLRGRGHPLGKGEASFVSWSLKLMQCEIVCWYYSIYIDTGWWFGTFFIFPYGDNHPNWLSYFSEG